MRIADRCCRYNRRFILFFLALMLLFSFSCKKKEQTTHFNSLHFHLETENKFFSHIQKARYHYFYNGWRDGTSEVVEPEAQLRFFNQSQNDRELHFTIQNPNHREKGRPLNIMLLLNGTFFHTLEINHQEEEFKLLLPKDLLKKGENLLSFKIKGYNIRQRFSYNRRRFTSLYIVKNIYFSEPVVYEFRDIVKETEEIKLLQPANSTFRIAVDSGEAAKLVYEFEAHKAAGSSARLIVRAVDLKGNNEILEEIGLSKNEKYAGSIDFKSNRKLLLEFEYINANKSSRIDWLDLKTAARSVDKTPPARGYKTLPGKPHVFIIVIDAARYDLVNQTIDGQATTPAIEEFSKTSYNFTNFYANAPYTAASAATLLSGFSRDIHSIWNNFSKLPKKIKTMPLYFEEIGYHTNGISANVTLFMTNVLRDFENIVICRTFGEPKYLDNSFVDIEKVKESIAATDFSKPQLFYIHLLPPHTPYNPPAEDFKPFVRSQEYKHRQTMKMISKFERFCIVNEGFSDFLYKCYLNNLYYADWLVGEILAAIKSKNEFGNSLIIVTSDHGEAFFEHKKYTHNSTNYQEMVHVPFFIKLPHQEKSHIITNIHSLQDLLPTFAGLLDMKANRYWQGTPIALDAGQKDDEARILYLRAGDVDYNLAIIRGKYKYLFYLGRDELYDLENDPQERDDLSTKEPFLTLYLKQELFNYLARSLEIKARLGIKEIVEKKRQLQVIEELKTLGYL